MTYVARMKTLGLTAYGSSETEAKERLEQMFSMWVSHVHLKRKTGKITEKILEPLGAEYFTRDDME